MKLLINRFFLYCAQVHNSIQIPCADVDLYEFRYMNVCVPLLI